MTWLSESIALVSTWIEPSQAVERVLFQAWPGTLLQTNSWRGFMRGFSIGLAIFAALLMILEDRWRWLARRRRQSVPDAQGDGSTAETSASSAPLPAQALGPGFPARFFRWITLLTTVVGVFCYFDFFNPNTRYAQYYHRHEFYHYYLGSKFFQEVSYSRLYECSLIAEKELGLNISDRSVRDLGHGNLIVPVGETDVIKAPENCKQHFSPERWTAFKEDIRWFERSARGSYWTNMQKDHGYNPAPGWTMTGKFLGQWGVASDSFFKKLALIDIGLHLGVLGLMGWAFGARAAMVASVFWGTNTASNFYWTGGAFLRQDWIFLLIAAMCCAKKGRLFLAGFALTWSSLLRVFPVVGLGLWAFFILKHWLRHRRLSSQHRALIGGVMAAGALLVPLSMWACAPSQITCAEWREKPVAELTTWDRSVCLTEPYAKFAAHISLHRETPLTNHMGLESMLVHNWDGRMRFTRDATHDDAFKPWKEGRTARAKNLKAVQYALALGLAAAILWGLRRSHALWLALPMSAPLIISLTNLTCYYYSLFLTFAALLRFNPSLGPALLATSAGSHILLKQFYFIDDRYVALSYLYWVMGLLVVYAMGRPFSRQALGQWLRSLGLMKKRATLAPPQVPGKELRVTPDPG